MINFTIGPVQMDEETRALGSQQIPYFRTEEFSVLMKQNEGLLCSFFDAPETSRVVFMTGSGTASMEGGVMNFFTKQDKVLVVNGGSFGHRLSELCSIHEIPFTEITLTPSQPLTYDHLSCFENKGYTGFLVQLCETSTGVLYDMDLIGDFCKRNNIFLFVDAISGFMADKLSMKQMNINAAITGSQKALALPPSMSFTVMDKKAIERCQQINVQSLYFNYQDYLKNGERGQTPFTPAVGTLIQLNNRLKNIEANGGIKMQNLIAHQRARYFREQLNDLPLKMFVKPEYASNSVTGLCPQKSGVSAYTVFEVLKNQYGIWVCPNGGDLAEKVFRVGHIGSISNEEIDILIDAFHKLEERGII